MFYCYKRMLTLATLSFFMLTQPSLGLDHLDTLLKMHPTWSFELVSVETMIQDSLNRLKSVDPNVTEAILRAKIYASLSPETTHIVSKVDDSKWSKNPPAHFDAREQWKDCAPLINQIQDAGACGTEGPVIAASIAADRYCIHTNGTNKQRRSAEMLAGCAEFCTGYTFLQRSFKYIRDHGIPTGGSYRSKEGCLPYTLVPCAHTNQTDVTNAAKETSEGANGLEKRKPCGEYMTYDHDCPKKCSNPKYKKSLDEDLIKFTTWYHLVDSEFVMRNDMQTYGPVATRIDLYDDFFQGPEKGMYRKRDGAKALGKEKFLKVIGWGEEEGTKYWLLMNTWDNWGESKVFKIPRGINHVWVERDMITGVYEDLH